MAKLTGRRQGLDQKKLAALEKVLKQAGITGQREILSGLRDHDEVIRVYNRDIKRYGLKSYLDKLPESSKKAIKERILRAEYKGKDKPIIPKYLPYNPKTKKGGYDLPGLKKQLKKDGLSDKDIDKVVVGVQRFRRENAGFGSTHLQGKKVDIPRYLLVEPEIIKLFVDKGYKILDEEGKGIWDIAFPVPGQKGSYKKVSGKRKSSSSKPGFKKAFDEARGMGQKEFEFDGKKFSTRMRGESVEEFEEKFKFVDDQKFDSPEESGKFKDAVEDEDLHREQRKIIEEARQPEEEIEVEDIELEETIPVDQSVPYGVYAQGQPEFEMAEEEQFMAAKGGEVKKYDNGGEVSSEFDFEDMGSGQDYIDSLQYEMPPYATRPDLRKPEPDQPLIPGAPEVRGFRPPREPQMEEVDIDLKVKEYVEQGQPAQSREELEMLIDRGVTTREEVNSLVDKYQRPEPEDIVAQGGAEPRDTPPGPMERKALGLGKEPPRKPKGASGSWEEEVDVSTLKETIKAVPKKRPPLTEEKVKSFKQLFNEAEKQRQKDETDLRRKEDEILAMVERPIDPKRLYKNMGTFDKVVALLGLAAGAYDSYKYGGPNLYMKRLNKALDDDIEKQKLEIKDQQYKKAQMLHNAKILSNRLARATKDRDKKSEFLKLENTLDKAYKKQLRSQNQKVRKIKFIETLNKRGLTSKEIAYADAIHPELKVGTKVIKGRDGLYYYTRGDVKKLKEYISDAQDSIDGLAQLEEYVDKVSILEQIPGASIISKDAAGAQSLRDRLVGKLRIEFFGPGVMTDQEREQAKKILGNPNAFFSRDSVEKEKIRNLLLKINYGIRQKLRRDGLAIPESRNDRMVKAFLKSAGKPLTDSNRARAVNALIAAEKKHVRLGGKPGKHWIMDEPLPI